MADAGADVVAVGRLRGAPQVGALTEGKVEVVGMEWVVAHDSLGGGIMRPGT